MVLGKRKTKANPAKPISKNKKSKPTDNSNPKAKKTKGKAKEYIDIPGLSPGRSAAEEESDEDARGSLSADHANSSDGQELLDEDIDLGQEAMIFLKGLDQKAITRLVITSLANPLEALHEKCIEFSSSHLPFVFAGQVKNKSSRIGKIGLKKPHPPPRNRTNNYPKSPTKLKTKRMKIWTTWMKMILP
jgi:hypothetical protein